MLKRATNRCNLFYTTAALRQSELKSDLARFATTNQTCLATIQVVVGYETFGKDCREWFYFLEQNLYM